MTIAGDNVGPRVVEAPRRWDIKFIRRFMFVFGIISSVFDCLTFAVLIWFRATMEQFRTGWFIESVVSASLIVLVVRSRRPFFKSRPRVHFLALATVTIVVVTAATPHLPFAGALGFSQCRQTSILSRDCRLSYVVTAEVAIRCFTGRNTGR